MFQTVRSDAGQPERMTSQQLMDVLNDPALKDAPKLPAKLGSVGAGSNLTINIQSVGPCGPHTGGPAFVIAKSVVSYQETTPGKKHDFVRLFVIQSQSAGRPGSFVGSGRAEQSIVGPQSDTCTLEVGANLPVGKYFIGLLVGTEEGWIDARYCFYEVKP
jgi:hypothetical protein